MCPAPRLFYTFDLEMDRKYDKLKAWNKIKIKQNAQGLGIISNISFYLNFERNSDLKR